MTESTVPTVLALLLCDQVIIDAQTNKKTLIGVFDNVNSYSYPATVKLALYAKLRDAEGVYDFRVRVVSLKDESAVANLEIKEARIPNPLQPTELAINIPVLQFREPGRYEFQLYANDVYLSRITIEARQISPPGGTKWQRLQ
jgi:Family of unknown function (DUF6941)